MVSRNIFHCSPGDEAEHTRLSESKFPVLAAKSAVAALVIYAIDFLFSLIEFHGYSPSFSSNC